MKTCLLILFTCLLIPGFSAQQSKNLQKGIEAYLKGDYWDAIYRIEKALDKEPANSECYYYLGLAKNGTNFNQGIEELSKAIELNLSYALAYNARGKIYIGIFQFGEAISDCSKAIQLDPRISLFYLNRAEAYLRNKKFELSILDCNKSMELDPEMTKYVLPIRAQSKAGSGDFSSALTDCDQMIFLDSKLLASLSADGRQIGIEPKKYMIRGDIRFKMKDFKGAIEDFYLGSEPEMDGGYALYRVGEAKLALNDPKGACEAFEEAGHHGIVVDEELENCK